MYEYLENISQQSIGYLLALACNLWLLRESVYRLNQLRWIFAALIYATVLLWYFVDPVYRIERYSQFDATEFNTAYLQVVIFLVAFRILLTTFAPPVPSKVLYAFDPNILSNGRLPKLVVLTWIALFLVGVSMMNFNVLGALFPIQARAAWGQQLWARPAVGRSTDFLISAAGYSYAFNCSLFGVIAAVTRNSRVRNLMLLMIAISWPGFILSGARHKILMVAMPAVLAILFIKPWTVRQKCIFLFGCVIATNTLMLTVIKYRNYGIDKVFADEDTKRKIKDQKHLGLNMVEELIYINRYQLDGQLPVEWGHNYFANAVNIIPRALWNNKPYPGHRFAELRIGYYRGNLAATISQGLIGQGVSNFGKWLGPIAPAFFLSFLAAWLCDFTRTGHAFLRACVVLVCFGTIPNFGRDLTMFSVWPTVFGTLAVLFYENQTRGKRAYSSPAMRHSLNSHTMGARRLHSRGRESGTFDHIP